MACGRYAPAKEKIARAVGWTETYTYDIFLDAPVHRINVNFRLDFLGWSYFLWIRKCSRCRTLLVVNKTWKEYDRDV